MFIAKLGAGSPAATLPSQAAGWVLGVGRRRLSCAQVSAERQFSSCPLRKHSGLWAVWGCVQGMGTREFRDLGPCKGHGEHFSARLIATIKAGQGNQAKGGRWGEGGVGGGSGQFCPPHQPLGRTSISVPPPMLPTPFFPSLAPAPMYKKTSFFLLCPHVDFLTSLLSFHYQFESPPFPRSPP